MSGPSARRRQVYTHDELKRLIAPTSVAIVGLSRRENSFGARTARNLIGFQGEVWGVNPNVKEIGGIACFSTLSDLPATPDCAILATPVEAVELLVEQCASLNVGGCVIFASGFAETGREDRVALQERLSAIARASGVRIVGPNCIGLINNVTKAGLSFTSGYADAPPSVGPVAIVSQSGGLGQSIAQVGRRGGAWSHYMAAGNSCDVDVCDYVSYLADDATCRVITCIAEGLNDGERLLEAGERALAANKPIVMYKVATGSVAAEAALSHTGTLAGSNAAYDAAYARVGIIKADNIEDVYETANFLAKAGLPKAAGVAAVAASGGACVITLDKAEQHAVAMPEPAQATRAILERNVPDFGNPSNPCDITAQVATNPSSYAACVEALLADSSYGALVIMMPSIVDGVTPRNIAMFSKLAEAAAKPICLSWMSEWKEGPGAALAEADAHLARFRSTDRTFATLAAWNNRAVALARRDVSPRGQVRRPEAALMVLDQLSNCDFRLSEREAKAIVAAYGVPIALDRVVHEVDEAVAASSDLGFPVALKVESRDIAHKTEAGVVRLGLEDEPQVRQAYAEIMAAAARVEPSPHVAGVLVQPMIGAGVEMVVGAKIDPTFGPMVVVGLGGIMVELLRDSATELAPVTLAQADAMIARLKGANLLTGFRGSQAIDRGALSNIVVAVSELISDLADQIAEIDINPIICSSAGAIAVDALVIRATTST